MIILYQLNSKIFYPNDPALVIKTKISFSEYLKILYRLAYRKPIMIFLVCLAFAIAIWIAFYSMNILNLPKPLFYQYLTLVLIIVVQPLVIYLTIRRNYYSSNHLREALEMEVTIRELKIKGESFYLELIWNKVFKIVENSKCFLIYQNNLSAIIILKKDLNISETNEIKDLFKSISNVPVFLK